jgi:hypothetical protein
MQDQTKGALRVGQHQQACPLGHVSIRIKYFVGFIGPIHVSKHFCSENPECFLTSVSMINDYNAVFPMYFGKNVCFIF